MNIGSWNLICSVSYCKYLQEKFNILEESKKLEVFLTFHVIYAMVAML